MLDRVIRSACVLGVATLLAAGSVLAQSPAVNPAEADFAKQQAQRQQTQPLNNQPLWSEVRSGAKQYTTVQGRETDILVQPQGQTWRALRTPIMGLGALAIIAAVIGLAVFFFWRGKLDYERRPADRVIRRFTPMDRYAHWLLAITWVTLAVTGLILSAGKTVLLPILGYTLFSWLATLAKNVHNFVGPVLIVAVPLMFVRYVRDNGIGIEDIRWFTHIVGYFKGHEYPSGKFNAGEKLVFWVVLAFLSTVLVITGLVLVFPNFDQTRSTMQTANVIHMVSAYGAIALACVHIYLGTIGMSNAYRAMRYGYVDASWAKHHHERWYEDVVAGRAREKFVAPQEVPPEALEPSDAVPPLTRRTAAGSTKL
jgi:formate dehydrogenase subunit gamma